MAPAKVNRIGLEPLVYKGGKTTLCAGCGHNAISERVIDAFYEMGVHPSQVIKLSGIGCSSKSPAYFLGGSHGFNAVHGRMEFNTVSISDGITMGTEGMRASLVSREVIADSIELVTRGNGFDGLVVLVGCDKTIPAGVMALARLNVPGVLLYGGSIAPGHWNGHEVTIQDVFEAVGANAAGRLSDVDLGRLEAVACPGAGACGGQFTANTMAIAWTS